MAILKTVNSALTERCQQTKHTIDGSFKMHMETKKLEDRKPSLS